MLNSIERLNFCQAVLAWSSIRFPGKSERQDLKGVGGMSRMISASEPESLVDSGADAKCGVLWVLGLVTT